MWQSLLFSYLLAVTAVPNGILMIYDETAPVMAIVQGPYYIQFAAELSFGLFFAGGEMIAETFPRNVISWDLGGMRYSIGAGLRLRNLEIGINRWCEHPVVTYEPYWRSRGILRKPRFEGGQFEIYIGLAGKSKLFGR